MRCQYCFLIDSLYLQPRLPFLCLSGGALKSRSVSNMSAGQACQLCLHSYGLQGVWICLRVTDSFTCVFLEDSLEFYICTFDSFRIHFCVWMEVNGKAVFLPRLFSCSVICVDAFFSPLGCFAGCQDSCQLLDLLIFMPSSPCLVHCDLIRQCFFLISHF